MNADSHADLGTDPTPRIGLWRRLGTTILKIGSATYAVVLGGLVIFESQLVYPGAYGPASPLDSDPEVEDFEYQTGGLTLRGRMLRHPSPASFLLYFHGNGVRAKELDARARHLSSLHQATVLVAEYRGYQDDTGTPSEAKVVEDALAAESALCEAFGITSSDVVLYGRSLGGAAAVAVAEQRSCKALVLDRTFDRMVDVAAEKFPILPVRLFMRNRYDSGKRLASYTGPLLQIHGTQDGIVPIEHGQRLFERCPSKHKEFVTVPGIGHNDPLPRDVEQRLATFTREPSQESTPKE